MWTTDSGLASTDLDLVARMARLRKWLRSHAVVLPRDFIPVLALCDSAAEVRFALQFVTLSTWSVAGERSFSDGRYRLELQRPIGPYHADFVLDSPDFPRPCVIEIDGPTHGGKRRSDARREQFLQSAGFAVRRVGSGEVETVAREFRQALMREQLERAQAPAPKVEPGVALAKRERIWPAHPLAYDVSGLPFPERRERVRSWLAHRGTPPTPEQLDILALCDRAGEVNFLLPFLALPRATLVAPNIVHMPPYIMWVQQTYDESAHTVDFLLVTDADEGEVDVAVIEITPPLHHSRDRMAEYLRHKRWRSAGIAVVTPLAEDATSVGVRWANSVRWAQEMEALKQRASA
jgi:very-short-patch-repair endonuclease